jgi:membrane protease YdiL (CAAX protease family)
MVDKSLIILNFTLFLLTFIAYFTVLTPYLLISVGLLCTLITIIYSIIFFRNKPRFKKLDKPIKGLFWTNFIFSIMVINILTIYIAYYIPSPKEFIMNAPVPPQYQWVELKQRDTITGKFNKKTPKSID